MINGLQCFNFLKFRAHVGGREVGFMFHQFKGGNLSARFPDFIGIGAARSGTTWVARQLAQHSDIWLPRIKELHYFSRSLKYDGPSYLNDSSLVKRVFSSEEHFQKYRYHLYRAIGSNLIRPSLDKLRWDCLYFFGQPSDDWYASLFATADNRIAGEITPQYSVLQVDDIKAIKKLNPDCKILFMMRDPVERAWSLLRYHDQRFTPGLTKSSINQLIKAAHHPAKLAQSDYRTILNNWFAVYSREEIFIGYYDQIVESPDKLVRNLFDFLNLDHDTVSEKPNSKVNQSFDKSMPELFRIAMSDYYYEPIQSLSQQYGGHYTKWLKQYDRVLKRK